MDVGQQKVPGGRLFQINFDSPVIYNAFMLDEPHRLVIDFFDTQVADDFEIGLPNPDLVRRVRMGEHPNRVVRLVFDLREPVPIDLVDDYGGKRLVVTLKRSQPLPEILPTNPPAEDSSPRDVGLEPGVSRESGGQQASPITPLQTPAEELSQPRLEQVEREAEPEPEWVWSNVEQRWSGYLSLEGRVFFTSPLDDRQHDANGSLVFEPEYYLAGSSGRHSLTIKPFVRFDQNDEERSHWDLREFQWLGAGDGWEVRAGVGKVFWGVTEAYHLVDIINQTDLVENIDGEQKLGQPMLKLSLEHSLGMVDFFVLPYFRERTFPGVEGRLRSLPHVDTDRTYYESDREQRHLDYAIRFFQTLGDWDIGLAHFQGTSRDPRLVPGVNPDGEWVLMPYYDLIGQTSLDLQVTKGDWLWKLETLYRTGYGDTDYWASTGGFEYTFWGVGQGVTDVGVLLEYLWDERGQEADQPFQNDLFSGFRWTFNNTQSTELLAGFLFDLDQGGRSFNLEASHRLGQSWKLQFEARAWFDLQPADFTYFLSRDDYAELSLYHYF